MPNRLLECALGAAVARRDRRAFRLGAAARRGDGTIVTASNGPATLPTPKAHAEARLCRKLDRGSCVVVVRVRRDGSLACSRPCVACALALRARGVAEVMFVDEMGE